MFTTVDDFKKSFKNEAGGTAKILGALTDESLAQSVCDGHRTIGRIAWHTVTTIPEMMSQTGLEFSSVDHKAPVPASASEIASGYKKVSEELLKEVTEKWNDDSLQQTDELYGETWKKGATLDILIRHEVHHRGQLTVLMRQAGLKVPGVYGPSKEEWEGYGSQPPEI